MDLNGNVLQSRPAPAFSRCPNGSGFRNGGSHNQLSDFAATPIQRGPSPLSSGTLPNRTTPVSRTPAWHRGVLLWRKVDGPLGPTAWLRISGGTANQSNSASNPCGTVTGGSYRHPELGRARRRRASGNLLYRDRILHVCRRLGSGRHHGLPACRRLGGSPADRPGLVVTEGIQAFLTRRRSWSGASCLTCRGERRIRGPRVYSSTRPSTTRPILFQNLWEPWFRTSASICIQETTADGTVCLKWIDTTNHQLANYAAGLPLARHPNMNCPGQPTSDASSRILWPVHSELLTARCRTPPVQVL